MVATAAELASEGDVLVLVGWSVQAVAQRPQGFQRMAPSTCFGPELFMRRHELTALALSS
jgi:hypothetical protein